MKLEAYTVCLYFPPKLLPKKIDKNPFLCNMTYEMIENKKFV